MTEITLYIEETPINEDGQMIIVKWRKSGTAEDSEAILDFSITNGRLEITHQSREDFQTIKKMVIE